MNINKIFKALSNETRLQILQWLKEPKQYFPSQAGYEPKKDVDSETSGVCVGLIQQKTALSQSTTSQYLSLLQDAGLVKSQRIGQWTYYQRNEAGITEFLHYIKEYL